uniref:ShKT domain-containing protein n=1 Tax=Magallana gigas TaxID=29159 RepID=A0A8W8P0U2_MAGGI
MDCEEYGTGACKAPYVSWATKNCAKTCGFCDLNKQKAQCVYSDWMTVSECSVTCGRGYKTEVRSFAKVKDKTPGSKVCKENLERYTACDLQPYRQDPAMVSLFGHSVYHLGVLTVWFCLLAVSQAAYGE